MSKSNNDQTRDEGPTESTTTTTAHAIPTTTNTNTRPSKTEKDLDWPIAQDTKAEQGQYPDLGLQTDQTPSLSETFNTLRLTKTKPETEPEPEPEPGPVQADVNVHVNLYNHEPEQNPKHEPEHEKKLEKGQTKRNNKKYNTRATMGPSRPWLHLCSGPLYANLRGTAPSARELVLSLALQ